MNELIFKLAKIGTRHATIAQALGLSVPILRKHFAPELLCGAAEAEIDSLFRTGPPKPRPTKPSEQESAFPRTPIPIVVFCNDGEPVRHD